MSHTIARLILAMLLLPATGVVFVLGMAAVAQSSAGGPPSAVGLLILWTAVYTFVFTYWILLWRSSVNWTDARIWKTALATGLSILVGVVFGAACATVNRSIPAPILILFGGAIVPIVWVLATVLVWRESAAERMLRLSALGGGSIQCPLCGYDLSGLRESRCPECGSAFTLDQLIASQPKREEHPAEL